MGGRVYLGGVFEEVAGHADVHSGFLLVACEHPDLLGGERWVGGWVGE